jgi:type VI protein secretion system component Hcp
VSASPVGGCSLFAIEWEIDRVFSVVGQCEYVLARIEIDNASYIKLSGISGQSDAASEIGKAHSSSHAANSLTQQLLKNTTAKFNTIRE